MRHTWSQIFGTSDKSLRLRVEDDMHLCHAEVCQLDMSLTVDENILRLQVPDGVQSREIGMRQEEIGLVGVVYKPINNIEGMQKVDGEGDLRGIEPSSEVVKRSGLTAQVMEELPAAAILGDKVQAIPTLE